MKVIIALLACVAAVAADGYQQAYKPAYKPSYQPSYQQPSYKPSYNKPSYHQESYAPTEYHYDVPANDHYGGYANTYVNRQPYSVQYNTNEYGGYGGNQYINFEQTFGQGYKGYH